MTGSTGFTRLKPCVFVYKDGDIKRKGHNVYDVAINDQAEHARLLAKRLNHYGDDWAHVNPIPLNPIEGSP